MPEKGQIIVIKKKKHGGHAHHGGSWKVAYADFVTAMMAFFLVMWIMGLSDSSSNVVSGYYSDPSGLVESTPKSEALFSITGLPMLKSGSGGKIDGKTDRSVAEVEQELKSKLPTAIGLQKLVSSIEFTITDEGLRIEFMEDTGAVFFESGSSRIRKEAYRIIQAIGPVLAKSKRRMGVEGHTDGQKYAGNDFTNWDLSNLRALEFRRALARYGVKDGQFVAVQGFADKRLKFPDKPLDAKNRRVVLLLPFAQGEMNPSDNAKIRRYFPDKRLADDFANYFRGGKKEEMAPYKETKGSPENKSEAPGQANQ